MAPALSVDYVIIHELSHLVHMNHSVDFWKLVDKIFYSVYSDDYNVHQDWLKKNGNTLVF
jgi:predicted metal-dependent hydrolase